MNFNVLSSADVVNKTVVSLKTKGYDVSVVGGETQALEKIKELIPQKASVMNGASVTLEQIGYVDLLKSGKHEWNDLHAKVYGEPDQVKRLELRKLALVSDYYLGSVHAVMENGDFMVVSNTGSQLPHVVYTSPNLIFVVGTQKIVPTLADAMKRLEEYVVPLEDKHMQKLYGSGTHVNKIVISKGESPFIGRKIHFIFVNKKLGF